MADKTTKLDKDEFQQLLGGQVMAFYSLGRLDIETAKEAFSEIFANLGQLDMIPLMLATTDNTKMTITPVEPETKQNGTPAIKFISKDE